MIKRTEIQAEKLEYICDECKAGVMRLVHSAPVTHTNPKQFLHRCSSCKVETHFTFILPTIVFKERKFMLADSLRQTAVNPSFDFKSEKDS
ncbi:hypothetical protein [Aliikangiella sp. IMCC44359]|uniref:hypothetical protein n=1 Tax=Aliikangiella sp. IMCC44359 TaxID=3459125 RepID=UPI00403A9105